MGGPTVKVRALARGLASSGHAVTVLTADLGLDRAKREIAGAVPERWGYEARENGVEAIYLRTRARYRALTWNPGVAAFCRDRLGGFDLTHIYGLYDLIGPRVAGACRRIARPYFVEPMGMFRPIISNIGMKRALSRRAGRPTAPGSKPRDRDLGTGAAGVAGGGSRRRQNCGSPKRNRSSRPISARRAFP